MTGPRILHSFMAGVCFASATMELEAQSPWRCRTHAPKKWGYIDTSGKVIIDYQFTCAFSFREGLASVQQNGKWGYIDKEGRFVIEPQFDSASSFYEGLASVSVRHMSNGVWTWKRGRGYIDKTGKFVIEPQFDHAHHFCQGLAIVIVDEKPSLIDKTGKQVTKTGFESIGSIFSNTERLRTVKINGKYGFMEVGKDCAIAIPPQFDEVRPFSEDLARVKVNGRWGYIDRSGKLVIKPRFRTAYAFSSGFAAVDTGEKLFGNNWGFIDKTGNFVIEPQFREVSYGFREGADSLVCARKGKKWGYIDRTGTFVIKPQFDSTGSILPFSHGLARVKINDKCGCIDRQGKTVIEPQWESISPFSSAGTAFVDAWVPNDRGGRTRLSGLIDKTGKVLVPPKWTDVCPLWPTVDDELIPVAVYAD